MEAAVEQALLMAGSQGHRPSIRVEEEERREGEGEGGYRDYEGSGFNSDTPLI